MKRKLFFVVAVLTITAASWNVNFISQTKGMSDVMLANVEALAQTELTPNGWVCFQNIRDDGGDLFFIVQWCGNCWSYSATSAIGSSYCWH